MGKINVAVVDRERRIYLGMAEVEEAALDPEIHLRQIDECDLPPHQYRWEAIDGHPAGGQFLPLPPEQRASGPTVPTMEHALAFYLLRCWERDASSVPDVSLMWLDAMLGSVDFLGVWRTPIVRTFAQARGIDLGDA